MISLPILGAGESGIGAALLGAANGYVPFVSDGGAVRVDRKAELEAAGIAFEEGGHDVARLIAAGQEAGFAVKSPGIKEDAPAVVALREAGVAVVSEIEFASRFAGAGHTVAITGSNGKTTTTALVAALLRDAGLDTACVGNIGRSWARDLAARRAEGRPPAPYRSVEVSSFQLDGLDSFRPEVAILLNITPDHLDRYGYDLGRYADSKWRITAFQTPDDVLVLNADDALSLERWAGAGDGVPGTRARVVALSSERTVDDVRSGLAARGLAPWGVGGLAPSHLEFTLEIPDRPFAMTIQELALQGKHNVYNSMAASVAARVLELRKEGIRESLQRFDAIEHRMEFVQEVNRIRFINDSKATNVNSAWYALESVPGPIVWIAGGVDKGNDYTPLLHLVEEKVSHLICLGADNAKLISTFGPLVDHVCEVRTAADAVATAYAVGTPGTTVLLSPACASFDLFGSYEERGAAFKAAVRAL